MPLRLRPVLPMLLLLATSPAAGASVSPSSAATDPMPASPELPSSERPLFGRNDLVYLVVTSGVVLAVGRRDLWLSQEAREATSSGAEDISGALQPFGNAGIVVPALAVAWVGARLAHARNLEARVDRIAIAVGVAGAAALAIKETVGRARPIDSPDDATDFQPFSEHDSFPSGHATIAFAAATGVTLESSWGGTPWIAYPLAAAVGWSRVRDGRHWPSDVVAGAALGTWTAAKTDRWLRRHGPGATRIQLGLLDDAPAAGLQVRF